MTDSSPAPRPRPHDGEQPETLFDVPPGARRPTARIVLLTGPSGCGKSALTRRLGLPTVALDDFYRDQDHPGMPHRYGIVDWDDPESWDADAALDALRELATVGRVEVPVYDIPTSRRTGTTVLETAGAPILLAEGVFAAELVERCRGEGILADAICLVRPRIVTYWFRLLRDVAEARKPVPTLVRRGLGLMRAEPALVRRWRALGCRPLPPSRAEREIRALA
ncbi:uridine kinase family protein [Isoptericola aurantiacus]|uniref:uridine kinase family protein n=1 Tax=Isoptericola aurantiacus TaxID=3377839 RepID=UPI00383B113A